MKLLPYGKILIVDEDSSLTSILKRFLILKNFKVDVQSDGQTGLDIAEKENYQLMLIDLNLPKISGLTLIEKLRSKGIYTPSIMLADEYSLEYEIESYKSGTNLFHPKPIEFRLLEVQVKSLINNKYKEVFEIGDLLIDLDSKKIYKNGRLLNLTKLEFNLLILFLKSNGKLYTRDEILRRIFYNSNDITSGAVDTLISRLRKKLEATEGETVIETVFKSGYRVSACYIDK